MSGICRVGDKNSVGGQLMTGAENVMLDGKPVALHPSLVSPHSPWDRKHPPHDRSVTTSGSENVFVEGKPVVLINSSTSCGHPIVEGSEGTFGT
jgi:uncharacterized Zn-binding protein involved in type VI secretion